MWIYPLWAQIYRGETDTELLVLTMYRNMPWICTLCAHLASALGGSCQSWAFPSWTTSALLRSPTVEHRQTKMVVRTGGILVVVRYLPMLMMLSGKTLVICLIIYEICHSPSMRACSKLWSPRVINGCGPFWSDDFMSKLSCLLRLHPTPWENTGTIM